MATIGIKLENPTGLAILDYDEHYGPDWYVTRINVPRAHRGKKLGSQLLDRCLALADKEKKIVWLEIQPSDGLNYNELEAWYLRHGFNGFMIYQRRPRKERQ